MITVKSWHWTTSLDLIKACYEDIASGSTSYIFPVPVLLGTDLDLDDDNADTSTLCWSVMTMDSHDALLQEQVFSMQIGTKVASRSRAIAKRFNRENRQQDDTDPSDDDNEDESALGDSDETDDDSDVDGVLFEHFEESLGDLAEDAEHRSSHATSSMDTALLSAMEVHQSLGGDSSHQDLDDSKILDAQEIEQNANLVAEVERLKINAAVGEKRIDLTSEPVSDALRHFESEGMTEENAAVEVALNSKNVMGNTDYSNATTGSMPPQPEPGDSSSIGGLSNFNQCYCCFSVPIK